MLARVVADTSTAGPGTPAAPAEPVPGLAAPVAAEPAPDPLSRRRPRPRLTHVDAMRPVKQLGVVSTHSLQSFAPAASLGVGASLMLTHVTRFAFMFISAAMLVYAYPAVARGGWRTFWRRRLLAVVLPYATWTVIYFAMGLAQAGRIGSIAAAAGHLGWLLLTGYDQLYFLVVLLQFYLIYPAFLWLIRRTERHHWRLLAASLAAEAMLFWLVHEQDLPGWMLGKGATRELWNYELFVIAGGVLAWHYQDAHAWLLRHWRPLLAATAAAVAASEAWFLLASHGVPGFRTGDPSDPFQPIEIPLYVGLITVIYLLGVLMGDERRPRWLRSLVQAGADYSYGIYLSQVLFLSPLLALALIPSVTSGTGWRVMFFLGGLPIIFAFLAWRYVPESPRWYESRGRFAEAREVLGQIEARVAAEIGRPLPPPPATPPASARPARPSPRGSAACCPGSSARRSSRCCSPPAGSPSSHPGRGGGAGRRGRRRVLRRGNQGPSPRGDHPPAVSRPATAAAHHRGGEPLSCCQ